jgi:hypothetical protein
MYLQCICATKTKAADYGGGGLKEEYMLYIRNILLQCYSYTATFPEYSPLLYIKLDLQCIYITLRCNVVGNVRGYRPSDYIYAAL